MLSTSALHSVQLRAMTTRRRLNVNLSQATDDALREHANRHGVSITEALGSLVGLAAAIESASLKPDQHVFIRGADGTEGRLMFVGNAPCTLQHSDTGKPYIVIGFG